MNQMMLRFVFFLILYHGFGGSARLFWQSLRDKKALS